MASTGDAAKATSTTSSAKQSQLKAGKSLDTARKQAASPAADTQNKKQSAPTSKAWQGPNPIISRASNTPPLTNGIERTASKPSPKASTDSQSEKHAHDRLLFLLSNMVGYDSTITLKSGEQFTGVLSGGSFDSVSKSVYTFKMVKRTRSPAQQANGVVDLPDEYIGEGDDHTLSFDIQDTIDLAVNNVAITAKTAQNGSIATSSFRTDTEISRASGMARERELKRWEPTQTDVSLDDMAFEESNTNGWDQFAVNKQKYGVETTYDENIYTTSIDTSHPDHKRRMAEAERLAREIEGSAAANSHVAEERRQDITTADDGDEEDKYSGVRRDITPLTKGASGSYVPPSRRPITNQPTIPGAPYDPAIISSQIAKPAQHLAVDNAKASTSNEPATDTTARVSTPSPIPAAKISPSTSTTEDHVRGTADAFKQFANNEKMRLKQAQELKRSNARNEKNVRINDLKKFAENFKLKSRVPDDLVPILAKDHDKQLEIKRKAEEAARLEEQKSKEAPKLPELPTAPRAKVPSTRAQFIPQMTQGMSPRQQHFFAGKITNRPGIPAQQVQPSLNIPTGPAAHNNTASPSSPLAVNRLNVNAKAFEFRPAASNFTPSATSPSPQRIPSSGPTPVKALCFFDDKEKAAMKHNAEEQDTDVIAYLKSAADLTDEQKKAVPPGGVPQPYRTNPTWTVPKDRENTNYEDMFPKPHMQRSPLHTPNSMGGSMTQHMPPNMPSNMSTPQRYYQQPHPYQGYPPGAAVQSSPRFQQAQVPFSAQVPHMPQFAGPVPVFGMSPSMGHRALQTPQGMPMMMQPYPHPQNTPMRQSYGQAPHFNMGGQVMMPQGQYMNPQSGYSPMPQHAQPHMQHGMPGYGSPRPGHPMQHTGSHQGFQPGMGMPYSHSPYSMNQRQMSAGQFPQATPRQHQVMPASGQPLPSPGMTAPTQGPAGEDVK